MATVYATPSQLYAQPNVTMPTNDGVAELLLSAASAAIDGFCNRAEDGFLALTIPQKRLFVGNGQRHLEIGNEFIQLDSVELATSIENNQWLLVPLADFQSYKGTNELPNFNRSPFNGLMVVNGEKVFHYNESTPNLPTVRIGAKWGYAETIPDVIVQATITLASRWLKRGQSFWSDTAGDDNFGSLSYRQAIDPDVKMMLTLSRMVRPTYGS